jgi:hemolysin activation/secretion protein
MFMRRRRPLAAAAMIGGTAYVANKRGQASAQADMAEQDQEARLEALEAQQAQQAAPPPAPVPAAPAPAAGGDDLTSQLVELKGLMDQGVLTQDEFNAAKAKLLAS